MMPVDGGSPLGARGCAGKKCIVIYEDSKFRFVHFIMKYIECVTNSLLLAVGS